jgi:hypothetical protein
MLRKTTSFCLLLPLACTKASSPGSNESGTASSDSDRARAGQSSRGAGSSGATDPNGAGNTRGASNVAGDTPSVDPVASATTGSAELPAGGEPQQAVPARAEAAAGVPTLSKGLGSGIEAVREAPPGALDDVLEVAVSAAPAEAALLPIAGNAAGSCTVPPEAAAVDTGIPDHVIGDGTPESCSADAVIETVALGGKITFDCGPNPIEITLDRPAKVFNDAAPEVVIDGGGLVTLSGGGTTRILYMNTCDPEQHFTTPHCDNQDTPKLTVQNLTLTNGNSVGELEYAGGGAIWARGGQLKVVNSRFFNNTCVDTGPDVGGAAIRAFSQYDNEPIYVVGSTFGGAPGLGNACSNGGGISSINVSWSIYNSVFSHNRALGNGGNPAEEGTPGGGSGGGIYSDGMSNVLEVCGTRIEDNAVNAFGSGIFFVNNDHGGRLELDSTVVRNNTGGGWNVLPGVSMHEDTVFELRDALLE